MKEPLQEIYNLENSFYIASYYYPNRMDYPLHFHDTFELTLTCNVRGERIVGNHVEEFEEYDLTLLKPNVIHRFLRAEGEGCENCEVTVLKFSKNLPQWTMMNAIQMESIRNMLNRSAAALVFSKDVARTLKSRIESIAGRTDFDAGIRFLSILDYLSRLPASEVKVLGGDRSDSTYSTSRRIRQILRYVENNYASNITLEDVGKLIGMSPTSVSRFFKSRTGRTFWSYVIDYRMECVQSMLSETDLNISEIAFSCGFNSLSNFNKVFRSRYGCMPREYRSRYKDSISR